MPVPVPALREPPRLALREPPHLALRPAILPVSLPAAGDGETGMASVYWQAQQTATGELFDPRQLTAAHKTLPLGSRARVTNLGNGRSVVVRINDRGPFKSHRIIDLSTAAGEAIGLSRDAGVAEVRIEPLQAGPARFGG